MFALKVQAPVAAPQQRALRRSAVRTAAPRARNVVVKGKGAEYTVTPVQADAVNGVSAELVQKCINAIRCAPRRTYESARSNFRYRTCWWVGMHFDFRQHHDRNGACGALLGTRGIIGVTAAVDQRALPDRHRAFDLTVCAEKFRY